MDNQPRMSYMGCIDQKAGKTVLYAAVTVMRFFLYAQLGD